MKKAYCQNSINIKCSFLLENECEYYSNCIFKSMIDNNTYAIIGMKDNTTLKLKLEYIIGTLNNKEIEITDPSNIKYINIWRYNKK